MNNTMLCRSCLCAPVIFIYSALLSANTIEVPKDYKTIQAAIHASKEGDTVLVHPGRYQERIQLKKNITVCSKGSTRAKETIIDGGGATGKGPGVLMAEGSTLEGFTITNVGQFNKEVWQKHFDTHGENLKDEEGIAKAGGSTAGISVQVNDAIVKNNIVHHNGSVGIEVIGKKNEHFMTQIIGNITHHNMGGGIGIAEHSVAIVRENICHENLRAGIGCRNANPIIMNNRCFKNVRAGIGCRESAQPVIRKNICYQNQRAGIGIRMKDTTPIVLENTCYENAMAGIGNRDGASPIIRGNRCYKNKMAGIGSDGSKPLIIGNTCRENAMAGIGIRGGAIATVKDNRCIENKLVAIGVTQGSSAAILNNELRRTGGVPPLVAVKDGSKAILQQNKIEGGGVAGVLIQGTVTLSGNEIISKATKQGTGIWIWKNSTVTLFPNSITGYNPSLKASKEKVTIIKADLENETK